VFTPVPGRVPLTPNKLGLSPTPVEPLPRQDSLVDELGLAKPAELKQKDPSRPPKPAVMRTIPPDPRTARPPEPTNKGEGGGAAWLIVLGVLLVGGGIVLFVLFA